MVVFGVAPVRERGLKFMFKPTSRESCRRSRGLKSIQVSCPFFFFNVAPVRERGLKYHSFSEMFQLLKVAPVRERGLKLNEDGSFMATIRSLP